jgi:tetratricopeptide (TPR) repeat protein
MSDDWFRNTDWNDAIARRFEEKLRHAGRKEEYLRIQACTLAPTHPTVALELLDRYFTLPDDLEHAQAYVDRATALWVLGRIEEAAKSYEAALQRESAFPNLKTQAYLDLPVLIATEAVHTRYDQALALLKEHQNWLMFPVEHFLWHSAHALILAAKGDRTDAATHAKQALAAASRDKAGFRYHPTVGFVTDKHRDLVEKLTALAAAQP